MTTDFEITDDVRLAWKRARRPYVTAQYVRTLADALRDCLAAKLRADVMLDTYKNFDGKRPAWVDKAWPEWQAKADRRLEREIGK